MAKKVSLHGGSSAGKIVPEDKPVVHGGVRETPQGIAFGQSRDMSNEQYSNTVDTHVLEAQDANDGTENGDQPSFKMPPFANGGKK